MTATLTSPDIATSAQRREPTADVPKLLVVTFFAPGGHHGGAVCLHRLLSDWPRERLVWAHHDWLLTDASSPWSQVEQWSVPLLRRPNRFGLHRVKELGNWTIHAPRVADEVAARARAAGVDAVLGIGPGLSVWTSHLIAQRLGAPLHLWIHDDPVAYAAWHRELRITRLRVARCFRTAYRAATVRYVISAPMREFYRRRFGCDAVILPPPVPAVPEAAPRRPADGRLRIGVAGSICGPEAWWSFLTALDRLYGHGRGGVQPEVHVFADPHELPMPASVRDRGWVRMRGWLDEAPLASALATMDYLYLSLWFDRARRTQAATSFSTKFASYTRVGVPILCHVPAYSAVAGFVHRYPIGPVLDTRDPAALANRLRSAFDGEAWHEKAARFGPQAAAEFDRDALARRFRRAVCASVPPYADAGKEQA